MHVCGSLQLPDEYSRVVATVARYWSIEMPRKLIRATAQTQAVSEAFYLEHRLPSVIASANESSSSSSSPALAASVTKSRNIFCLKTMENCFVRLTDDGQLAADATTEQAATLFDIVPMPLDVVVTTVQPREQQQQNTNDMQVAQLNKDPRQQALPNSDSPPPHYTQPMQSTQRQRQQQHMVEQSPSTPLLQFNNYTPPPPHLQHQPQAQQQQQQQQQQRQAISRPDGKLESPSRMPSSSATSPVSSQQLRPVVSAAPEREYIFAYDIIEALKLYAAPHACVVWSSTPPPSALTQIQGIRNAMAANDSKTVVNRCCQTKGTYVACCSGRKLMLSARERSYVRMDW
jgi:chemotaxis protein histidine kinase CheA